MLEQQMTAFALLGAEWVLWLLVALSVLVIAVAIERLIYSTTNATPTAPFRAALQKYVDGGPAKHLDESLKDMNGVEARIIHAGVAAGRRGGPKSAEEAISGAMAIEKVKLDRRLIVLGTVGSNAPFIGLFGTVLGIIQAFHELALDSDEGANAVMAGISEALVATAVGLLVAIPAVVLYNYFQRRNKELMARVTSLSHMLLSRLKDDPKAAAVIAGET
jgi:biopolymer transport protein ExbB